jgi:hypothetical protein
MKRLAVLLSLFLILFVSCSKDEIAGSVLIRVLNQSDKQLNDVSVFSRTFDRTTEVEKNYGSVSSGSFTSYQTHKIAYNYPLFKLIMQDYGSFEAREIRCGVGLAELEPGKYSLLILNGGNCPIVRLVKD